MFPRYFRVKLILKISGMYTIFMQQIIKIQFLKPLRVLKLIL